MSNLEARYYADPAIHAAERSRIFARTWQPLCSAGTLVAPGGYIATEIAGAAIVAIRGDDGVLRAFHNVCRHRGSRLVEPGTGNCATLTCPFHGWTYDSSGNLRSTPWFTESTPFELDKLALASVHLKEWRGLVFAALAPDRSVEQQLGDLPSALADVPLESFAEVASDRLCAPINWKTYLDQFCEYYHTPTVHAPDKSVGIEFYTAEPAREMMCMLAPEGTAFYGGRWLWAWPNWTLSIFPGGMKTSRVEAVAPEKIDVHFHYFFADVAEATKAARQRVIDATRSIFAEDVRACERAQANYSSGHYAPGPLHPRHEKATAYFQGKVREALAGI